MATSDTGQTIQFVPIPIKSSLRPVSLLVVVAAVWSGNKLNNEMNIKGKNKALILAALYNASRPLGMGFMQYQPGPMDEQEAARLLVHCQSFDYLKGRVMKIDLSGDELDPWLYDRDNGQGAAERALAALHLFYSPDNPETQEAHKHGTAVSVEAVEKSMGEKSTLKNEGDVAVFTVGLEDVKDSLKPQVEKAKQTL